MLRSVMAVSLGSLGWLVLSACDEGEASSGGPDILDLAPVAERCLIGEFERVADGFVYRCGDQAWWVFDGGASVSLGTGVRRVVFDADRNPILVRDTHVERFSGVELEEMVRIPGADVNGDAPAQSGFYAFTESKHVAVTQTNSVIVWNDDSEMVVDLPSEHEVVGMVAIANTAYVVHHDYFEHHVSGVDLTTGAITPFQTSLEIVDVVERDGAPLFAGVGLTGEVTFQDLDASNEPDTSSADASFGVVADLCEHNGLAVIVSVDDEFRSTLVVSDQSIESRDVFVLSDDFFAPMSRCSVYNGEVFVMDVEGVVYPLSATGDL